MMHTLQIRFTNRNAWIAFDVDQTAFDNVEHILSVQKERSLGFIELRTAQGQHLWINLDRIAMIRYLVEDKIFTPLTRDTDIESQFENDPDDAHALWGVTAWMEGCTSSVEVGSLSGEDWSSIVSALEAPDMFTTVTDEDHEGISLRVSSIEAIIAFADSFYHAAGDYLPVLNAEVSSEKNPRL